MKYIDIHLKKLDNPAYAKVFDDYCINIDFNQCKIEADEQNKDFIEMVARVINHEILHYAIFEITNVDTTIKFDRIARNLKEYWGW